jgi:hypothetical protein
MMRTRLTRMLRSGGDSGVAMVLIIGVAAMITVLTVTVATVSLNNLQNTTRDKQAGSAFATSEAGVASVVERIRSGNITLSSLTCMEPLDPATPLPASCTGSAMSWTSSVNPMQVRVDGGAGACPVSETCYKVWIGTLSPYSPPTTREGTYRVHSRGLFGNGPAARTVVVDLVVKPDEFPIGVFGEAVSGNGGTAVYNESLFTRGCVSPRHDGSGNGTRFTGMDVYWDQPASAHSTAMVSTANNCAASGDIHASTNCPAAGALRWDQSAQGGPVSSGACYRNHQRSDGSWYPDASPTEGCVARPDGLCDSTSFTVTDLQRYGYRPRGLSDTQYSNLKQRAQTTSTYNQPVSTWHSLLTSAYNAGYIQPVVYVDCSTSSLCAGGTLNFARTDFPDVFKQAPDASGLVRCASGAQPVVTIVVEHGNVVYQGGNTGWLDAAIFVPDGQWRGNGGYNILGTLFANDLSLGGNETFQLDKCFVRDLPSSLLEVKATNFREDDARDVG